MVVDWAIEKKPPFHHKDNSVADALIFLSTVDFFYNDFEEFYIDNTIFISNNTSDFSKTAGDTKLHPELQKMLNDKPILFERNLATALDASDEIIVRYNGYLDYLRRDVISCMMSCKGTEYFAAEVLFNEKVLIEKDEDSFDFNPNQYRLNFGNKFDLSEAELVASGNRYKFIDVGFCNFCYATHIRCICEEVHASYGSDIECGCGREFTLSDDGIRLSNTL